MQNMALERLGLAASLLFDEQHLAVRAINRALATGEASDREYARAVLERLPRAHLCALLEAPRWLPWRWLPRARTRARRPYGRPRPNCRRRASGFRGLGEARRAFPGYGKRLIPSTALGRAIPPPHPPIPKEPPRRTILGSGALVGAGGWQRRPSCSCEMPSRLQEHTAPAPDLRTPRRGAQDGAAVC
jgi:hypothetical protein